MNKKLMVFIKLLIPLLLSFQLFAADCDPVIVFKNLRSGGDYLPYTVRGVDHQRLDKVTEFVNQEARRTGKTPEELVEALKRIDKGDYTQPQIQSLIDKQLESLPRRTDGPQVVDIPDTGVMSVDDTGSQITPVIPSSPPRPAQSGEVDLLADTGAQSAPIIPSSPPRPAQRGEVDLLADTGAQSTPDFSASPTAQPGGDAAHYLDDTGAMPASSSGREQPSPQNFQKAEDYIYYDGGLHKMKSRPSSGTITPELHPSHVHLPKGVDFDSPIHVTYDAIELDFDLMATNTEYLRSPEYLERFGPQFELQPRNPEIPSDIGTSISGGTFKDAYVTKDGSHVVKVFKQPDPTTMSPEAYFKAKETMMQGVRRELAVEQFLLEIERRYRAAGLEAPFRVLPINKDPELLKRGIIIQEVAKGKPVNKITRANLDAEFPHQAGQFKPTKEVQDKLNQFDDMKGMPLHQELEERIPEIKELMAVLDRYKKSIQKTNHEKTGNYLYGQYRHVTEQGELGLKGDFMPVDYGGRFRNLAYDRNRKPPFEFFDW